MAQKNSIRKFFMFFSVLVISNGCIKKSLLKPLPQTLNEKALYRLLEEAKTLDSDALIILHRGHIVKEWFKDLPRLIDSMSITKSITSLAIGRLLETKKISSLDLPIYSWYPEWSTGLKKEITLRHILEHTSGLQANKTAEEIYQSPDIIELALEARLVNSPGSVYFYNNKAVNLLAGIVQKITTVRLDKFIEQEIFNPLKIKHFKWHTDLNGNPLVMAGLEINPLDLAKIGQLMLNEGRWENRQIINQAFIKEATARKSNHHGLLWWIMPDNTGFYSNGWQGQWLIAIPKQELVIVRMRSPKENTAQENERYGFNNIINLSRELNSPNL